MERDVFRQWQKDKTETRNRNPNRSPWDQFEFVGFVSKTTTFSPGDVSNHAKMRTLGKTLGNARRYWHVGLQLQ